MRRELVDEERVRGLLPKRPLDGHKGTFGTLVVAGGCLNYPGAPLLAGKAAARMGVGLVREAVAEPLLGLLAPQFAEAVWTLLPHQQGVLCGRRRRRCAKHCREPDKARCWWDRDWAWQIARQTLCAICWPIHLICRRWWWMRTG